MSVRRAFSLSEVLIVIGIMGILLAISIPAIYRARSAAERTSCQARLGQIGLALYLYHGDHRALPPGCTYNERKDPLLFMSWCTRLLPYCGQDTLWRQALEGYRSTRNYLKCPPHVGDRRQPLLVCPSEPVDMYIGPYVRQGYTHYLGSEGTNQFARNGLIYVDSKVNFAQVTDGASNTVLVGERPAYGTEGMEATFGWWYASEGQDSDGSAGVALGAREFATNPVLHHCGPASNRFQPSRRGNVCDLLHFWSMHEGGASFLFADKSVRFLSYSADSILPALATRAGGEAVSSD